MLFKNVASQKIHVYAYNSTTGAAKTGDAANITAYVSLDGTANAIDDTNPAEVDSTNMPGIYVFDLAQAETNCDSFALYAKSSTSNIRIEPIIGFTTGAAGSLGVDVTKVSGDSDAADNLELMFDGTGYAGGTTKLQVDLKSILATALTETSAGYLAAAFKKLFDVASPVLTAASVNQGADNNVILSHGTYGNSALKTLLDTTGIKVATNADKTGYALTVTPPTAEEIKTAMEAVGGYLALIKTAAEAVDTLTKASGDGDLAALLTAALAIKIKTDKMTYTSGNDLDVNVQKVNDTALTGNGSAGTPWGPA